MCSANPSLVKVALRPMPREKAVGPETAAEIEEAPDTTVVDAKTAAADLEAGKPDQKTGDAAQAEELELPDADDKPATAAADDEEIKARRRRWVLQAPSRCQHPWGQQMRLQLRLRHIQSYESQRQKSLPVAQIGARQFAIYRCSGMSVVCCRLARQLMLSRRQQPKLTEAPARRIVDHRAAFMAEVRHYLAVTAAHVHEHEAPQAPGS